MLKRIAAILLVVLSLSLTGCVSKVTGLKSYVDTGDGYQFLYPNGWLPIAVPNGPDVVFRDLIQQTENVSVVISPVTGNKTLADLGTPTEVGYKLSKNALAKPAPTGATSTKTIAPTDSGRQAELVNAESRESRSKNYYILEYAVKLPNQERHNLASVAISRGKLFTLNVSTTEERWPKVKEAFEKVVKSFSVY
ncbi:photosystem II reaction center PsbP family protein [Lyngbya sp. CCAP 1446/10]|uniref:photosystem II reaction center PsbP n=1 Tax=Microcoleaceae TaxID=1892252 RepID=UPI0022372C3E|nr:photosystem II reaction center PsbP [Lyngbya sp. CCAP 1446/10]MCW6053187.1 photosystem II reaction center PsbP family protein [Lyngbya sp. CCAP 1446/10]